MARLCYIMHRDDAFDGVLPTLPTAPDHSLECAFAFGTPRFHGRMRAQCADFEVSEILGFEPDDDGDHLLLYVEKEGITTSDLVAVIARAAGLATREVGYCGMKDRQA
ncbi:MAG: tRNA pseudouridine(13) synthase TruD, partial [Gammaproteobacteria bacterium]|nr:tRNA pseudouridine(13) synthase TruD [Gammaproteobacteria bacterium]